MASSTSTHDGHNPHYYTQQTTATRPLLNQDVDNPITAAMTASLKTQQKVQVTRDLIIGNAANALIAIQITDRTGILLSFYL
ncbi:hypothetical protein [Kistimonas asteriae]|uniref:hypothetical protein n=1 Tax=Kistimonas asteriae TaxID=517724 RepID=UPI001BAB9DBE|nr:hypothetical protein [Kistimonas asteriae]